MNRFKICVHSYPMDYKPCHMCNPSKSESVMGTVFIFFLYNLRSLVIGAIRNLEREIMKLIQFHVVPEACEITTDAKFTVFKQKGSIAFGIVLRSHKVFERIYKIQTKDICHGWHQLCVIYGVRYIT